MDYLDILVKLRKINRSINLESKRIEKEFGISLPQLLVLKFLSDRTDYIASASKIKKFINLNASTVTGIIQRLESKEMVAKLPDDSDKRSSRIILTAKGYELLKKTPSTLQQKMEKRISNLSPDKMETLMENLALLSEIMELDSEK